MSIINQSIVDQIREAYVKIRETNHDIPDEILNIMKNAAIDHVTHADIAKAKSYINQQQI